MIPLLEHYNVVWDLPSKDFTGSMPLGNGDIGLNAWVEPTGDLLLLISKTDAWDENSINLKLGRIRLKFLAEQWHEGIPFKQTLNLKTATLEIEMGTVSVRVWVDANHPVIQIEADSQTPFDMRASLEMWRTEPRKIATQTSDMFKSLEGPDVDPYPTIVQPDHLLKDPGNRIIWCHSNREVEPDPYVVNMKLQGLGDLIDELPHPLLHRTFGAAMEGNGFVECDAKTLKSKSPGQNHRLQIHALTLHPSDSQRWQKTLDNQIANVQSIDLTITRKNHEQWWDEFWNRSWIYVTADSPERADGAFQITQGCILQRFMDAAAGRGKSPIKHNGSLFSVGTAEDPDFRRWGGPGFWFQNQRLIYWPMLAAGDFDLMLPWFSMYRDSLELQRHRTETYFHHGGAHFPETITFWGSEVSAHYGWTPFEKRQRPEAECRWLTWYWTGGVELTLMMYEYFKYTRDEIFARITLLPVAEAVMEFFDLHYPRDERGKIRFHPAQSLETWHEAVNPLPEIAGLDYTLTKLLSLPSSFGSPEHRRRWARMLGELPAIPIGEKDGKRVILPAEKFDIKKNTEHPELYSIFPYRIFGLGKPDLQLAKDTFDIRLHPRFECWHQDDIQLALMGRAEQAREWLEKRASPASHSESRFPAFWNAFHDWVPDVDHGGVLQLALQLMLLQAEGGQLRLLPAWPAGWNAEFKLHAPGRTIVEGAVTDGKLVNLQITPPRSQENVLVP